MKKTTLSLLALVSAITCAFGLSACGGNHTHKWQDAWSGDATHHWHACNGCDETKDKAEHVWNAGEITEQATAEHDGTKTYTCTVTGCGKTKTESVKYAPRYTVSEDEWAAAFDLKTTNCTISVVSEANSDDFSYTIYLLGNRELKYESPNGVRYTVKENGEYYYYVPRSGGWEKYKNDEPELIDFTGIYDLYVYTLSDKMQYFTYSEENKCYMGEIQSGEKQEVITVRFLDGKLVFNRNVVSSEQNNATYELTVTDYGVTTYSLPDFN
ncbi:MAG: hypothetical protein NC311_12135 [Muribaculaceae bacterium]|nr:hypothetical protein [Muribaculaceae bacterium]